MDFYVTSDKYSQSRYDGKTGKVSKLPGTASFYKGYRKAIRGNEGKKVKAVAKMVYETNLPYAFFL